MHYCDFRFDYPKYAGLTRQSTNSIGGKAISETCIARKKYKNKSNNNHLRTTSMYGTGIDPV